MRVVLKSYPQFLVNDVKFQPESSNACGKYCLLVAALNKIGLSPYESEATLKTMGNVDDFVLKTIKP